MKRHLILVVLLLFASPLIVAADGPAAQADAPEATVTDPVELFEGATMSTLDEDRSPSEEPLFVALEPTLCTHPEPSSIDCDNWDSNYCDYEWDCECCCVAVWKASGANCGNICV